MFTFLCLCFMFFSFNYSNSWIPSSILGISWNVQRLLWGMYVISAQVWMKQALHAFKVLQCPHQPFLRKTGKKNQLSKKFEGNIWTSLGLSPLSLPTLATPLCTAIFRSLQKCSIRFRSGLWLSHSKTFTGSSRCSSFVLLAAY